METTTAPVIFTTSAIDEIKRLMTNEPGKVLRVGVKGGGCSGMTYILEFSEPTANDEHFNIADIPCVMDRGHAIYLAGMEVNWEGGLNSRGFTFSNPNASTTCGCGTSFGI